MNLFSYYSTMGADPSWSDEQIKEAHRRLSRQHHPDRGGDPAVFSDIQTAFRAVRDAPARRLLKDKLMGLGDTCSKCDGRGYTIRQIKFTTTIKTTCGQCNGCGYIDRRTHG